MRHPGILRSLGAPLLLSWVASNFIWSAEPIVAHFPDDYTGSYVLVDADTDFDKFDKDKRVAKQIAPLKGEVSIPVGKQVFVLLPGQRFNKKRPYIEPLEHLGKSSILGISFVFSDIGPTEAEQLDHHKGLKWLSTTLCKLDDDALRIVCESAKQLEVLKLPETKITNASTKHIAQLLQLRVLNLYGTQVTHDGFSEIKKIKQLRRLNIGLTRTNGAGLKHLKDLTELRELVLWKINVQSEHLAHLSALSNLERLDCKETNVGDEGLRHLTTLTKLKFLDLSWTRITDDCLTHLKQLKSLETLLLLSTQVTPNAADELKKAIPNLEVVGVESKERLVEHRKKLDKYFESWD